MIELQYKYLYSPNFQSGFQKLDTASGLFNVSELLNWLKLGEETEDHFNLAQKVVKAKSEIPEKAVEQIKDLYETKITYTVEPIKLELALKAGLTPKEIRSFGGLIELSTASKD